MNNEKSEAAAPERKIELPSTVGWGSDLNTAYAIAAVQVDRAAAASSLDSLRAENDATEDSALCNSSQPNQQHKE